MKIAIITIHSIPNYGSALQAFALQKYLSDTHPDDTVVIIDYEYRNRDQAWRLIKRNGLVKYVRSCLVGWLHSKEQNSRQRLRRFDNFRREQMLLSRKYVSYNELKHDRNLTNFDLYITGSDQVWNSKTVMGDPAYLWAFLPDDCKRIAFSASFGIDTLYNEYIPLFTEQLAKYSSIGIREYSGLKILDELSVKCQKTVTCDPTFLLPASIYTNLAAKSQITISEDYILVYALTYAFNPKPAITHVIEAAVNKYHCKVIFMSVSTAGYEGPKTVITNGGPYEFLYLIMHARYVITSSFHGTAFSSIFRIPFSAICPKEGDKRIFDYIHITGLDKCVVYSDETTVMLTDTDIYGDEFETRYLNYIQKSKDFLKTMIYAKDNLNGYVKVDCIKMN